MKDGLFVRLPKQLNNFVGRVPAANMFNDRYFAFQTKVKQFAASLKFRLCHQLQIQLRQRYSLSLGSKSTGCDTRFSQKLKFVRREPIEISKTPIIKLKIEIATGHLKIAPSDVF